MQFDEVHHIFGNSICRRSFLKAGALALGCSLFPQTISGAVIPPQLPERTLSFYNLHTDESLKVTYWYHGEYITDALSEIDFIMRDFRTNEIKTIDSRLIELLHTLRNNMESQEKLHIISGYRSPTTNTKLHKKSGGVAAHSLHMQGKAADIRLPGKSLESLWKTAKDLKLGGVGYYPSPDFIHVDIGRVRTW